MSRNRPSDTYTRFTSNGPHAAQKPPATSFNSQKPSQANRFAPGPSGETAAQKVARLRMEARAQKMGASLSPVDKMLVRGRRWADNMHTVTTFFILGLTGVSAVVATYGIVGLVRHSRRQKRAFIEREMDRLYQAQQAFLRGEADAEQLHLLEQERAGDEMDLQRTREKQKKQTDGIWAKAKGFVGMGAAEGDMGTETPEEARVREMRNRGRDKIFQEAFIQGEVRPAAVEKSSVEGVGFDAKGRPVPINKMERVVQRKNQDRPVVVEQRTPGPFDVMADNIAEAVIPNKSNGGWLSWVRGSSS